MRNHILPTHIPNGAREMSALRAGMSVTTKDLFRDTEEAVAFFAERGVRLRPQTLVNYRLVGGGPRFHRFGRRVVYAESELEGWLQQRLGSPLNNTSEITKHARSRQCARERRAGAGV